MSGSENVHSLDEAKRNREQQEGASDSGGGAVSPGGLSWLGHDLSKWAMLVSLLSLVLMLIFFFGLTQNVTGVADEVESVSQLRGQIEGLQALLQGTNEYVGALDGRLGAVEQTQSGLVRQAVLEGLLSDMRIQAAALAGAVTDPAQAAKIAQLQELLEQLSVTAP